MLKPEPKKLTPQQRFDAEQIKEKARIDAKLPEFLEDNKFRIKEWIDQHGPNRRLPIKFKVELDSWVWLNRKQLRAYQKKEKDNVKILHRDSGGLIGLDGRPLVSAESFERRHLASQRPDQIISSLSSEPASTGNHEGEKGQAASGQTQGAESPETFIDEATQISEATCREVAELNGQGSGGPGSVAEGQSEQRADV